MPSGVWLSCRRWLSRWRVTLPARWNNSQRKPHAATAHDALQKQLATTPAPGASIPSPTVFVTVFGLSAQALEDVVELVAKKTGGTPIDPVFITDSLAFDVFRRRRLRFEYLPDRGTQTRFAPDLDWEFYERRRYALLREKWRPRSLVCFGRSPPPECTALFRSAE